VENQHRLITGYRELEQDEIAVMNILKSKEQEVLAMLDGLNTAGAYDKRWIAMARDHIELGFMAANRSVARPTPGHPEPKLSHASVG
jgi:hypothetical protein